MAQFQSSSPENGRNIDGLKFGRENPQDDTHIPHDPDLRKDEKGEVQHLQDSVSANSSLPDKDPQESDTRHRKQTFGSGGGAHPDVDPEKNIPGLVPFQEENQKHGFSNFYSRYRIFFHLFIWLVFTG